MLTRQMGVWWQIGDAMDSYIRNLSPLGTPGDSGLFGIPSNIHRHSSLGAGLFVALVWGSFSPRMAGLLGAVGRLEGGRGRATQ